MSPADVSIESFAFLEGSWSAEVWGGLFEETWSSAKGETMVMSGRHFVEEKTSFMEFGSIQKRADGKWTLYMVLGSLVKGSKTPVAFALDHVGQGEALFVNLQNDFPTHIRYAKTPEGMICEIWGKSDGTEGEKTGFVFRLGLTK